MDANQFEDHLDRFGGDLARWPADISAAGIALLATSSDARAAKAAMDRVEAGLRLRTEAVPATDLVSRIASQATRQRQERRSRPVWRTGWGAIAAVALILGVLVGTAQTDVHEDSPDQVVATALDATGSLDVD